MGQAVPALVNAFFEKRVKQLFDLAEILDKAFSSAGIDYRVVGGLATYLYVEERAPDAGRLTRDIDVAVRRRDLECISKAMEPFGFKHRRVAGVDTLVQGDAPSVRRAVHLVFSGEKVRPEYHEPVPEFGPFRKLNGIRLMPLADLIRMKLTSFRAKDEAHIKDLDEAGLITPEIETELPPVLRERLAQARARD
jgi:hypothetical protein